MRIRFLRISSTCTPAQRKGAVALSNSTLNLVAALRSLSTTLPLASEEASTKETEQDGDTRPEKGEGAMSRRLAEMTHESIDAGGSSARGNIEAAGFSEELKKQLEARISDTAFHNQNQMAFTEVKLPSSAGKGTRDQATAQPWTGSESLHDSALRMLDDSHKRLGGFRTPRVPQPSNLRPAPGKSKSTGERLANARDRTSIYAAALSNEMTEAERAQVRQELKERFTPGARPMATTLQGLTSLANERIEDAIARGQFKNIPRGKGKNVERDYNASSPFLDTTEYFMNKIIQKQQIVPPWIEKQQELTTSTASFRARLRNDWKRHAARMIASAGGTLESQIRRAQAYALAEEQRVNRSLHQESTDNASTTTDIDEANSSSTPPPPGPDNPPPNPPNPAPFRDPHWLATEHAYHTLSISTLNNLTRSYNLLAPALAQKPYLVLDRELHRCYAAVAPLLADEIRERAVRAPGRGRGGEGGDGRRSSSSSSSSSRSGEGAGLFLGSRWMGHETKGGYYGFREFWREWFSR